MAYEIEGGNGLDTSNINWASGAGRGTGFAATGVTPDKLVVHFYRFAECNQQQSKMAGRPIYQDFDYVQISQPGEHLNIVRRRVKDEDKFRWADKWRAYQENRAQAVEGTQIELLFPTHPATAHNLRSLDIHTIEQLADATAPAIASIGPYGHQFVRAAQDYLEKASKGVPFHQHEADLVERDKKIAVLTSRVETLIAQNQELTNQVNGLNAQVKHQWGPQYQQPQQQIQPQQFVLAPPGMEQAQPQPEPMKFELPPVLGMVPENKPSKPSKPRTKRVKLDK